MPVALTRIFFFFFFLAFVKLPFYGAVVLHACYWHDGDILPSIMYDWSRLWGPASYYSNQWTDARRDLWQSKWLLHQWFVFTLFPLFHFLKPNHCHFCNRHIQSLKNTALFCGRWEFLRLLVLQQPNSIIQFNFNYVAFLTRRKWSLGILQNPKGKRWGKHLLIRRTLEQDQTHGLVMVLYPPGWLDKGGGKEEKIVSISLWHRCVTKYIFQSAVWPHGEHIAVVIHKDSNGIHSRFSCVLVSGLIIRSCVHAQQWESAAMWVMQEAR